MNLSDQAGPPGGQQRRAAMQAPRPRASSGAPRTAVCSASAVAGLCLALLTSPAEARNAYVTESFPQQVSVFNIQTEQAVGSPIPVGDQPIAIAITPDGKTAYVANINDGTVSVIDTRTNQTVGAPISVGGTLTGIAIAPNGHTVYVTKGMSPPNNVAVLSTQTNQVVGSISVGNHAAGIAITPNGKTAYVGNTTDNTVSVINTQTNKTVGSPISVGTGPDAVAVTPDGNAVYVANDAASGTVSVIDTHTNQVVGSAINVGANPLAIAITPDGKTAYVANGGGTSVSVIDTRTHTTLGSGIAIPSEPEGIGITPDGHLAFVGTDASPNDAFEINTHTNGTVGSGFVAGSDPAAIVATPNQAPIASFTATGGSPLRFDGAHSRDPDGAVVGYRWDFGDGRTAFASGPKSSHRFKAQGRYFVTLTVTDNEGCSTALVFTGQTAYCNGSAAASSRRAVIIARLKCPKSAPHSVCSFKVKGVTKKHRGKAETKVTKARVKAGKSKLIELMPKSAYATKLSTANSVLLTETVKQNGSKKTHYVKLKL